MGGLIYTAPFQAIAHTLVTDLFWIGAPTDAAVEIMEFFVGYDSDETDEQLRVIAFRTTTDNALNGTGITPNPSHVGYPAAVSVVRRTITGGSLAAETTLLYPMPESSRNGWLWVPKGDDDELILSPVAATAGRLVFKLADAPAASRNMSGYLKFKEIGG